MYCPRIRVSRRSDHLCPGRSKQRQQGSSHSAGRPDQQNPLPRPDVRSPRRRQRGLSGGGECRSVRGGESGRTVRDERRVRLDNGVLGHRAGPERGTRAGHGAQHPGDGRAEHLVADRVGTHTLADLDDGAGEVDAGSVRELSVHDTAEVPAGQAHVGRVDRGGGDPHPQLPGPGSRHGDFGDRVLLGRAVVGGDDGFHHCRILLVHDPSRNGPGGQVPPRDEASDKRTERSTC